MLVAASAACSGAHDRMPAGDPSDTNDPGTSSSTGDGTTGGSGTTDGGSGGSGSDGGGGATGDARCAPDNGGITLPPGFCAQVFVDHPGKLRHITVTPSGHVFVAVAAPEPVGVGSHVLALYDADNNGVADEESTFGIGGNGILWRDGWLYVAADDRIVRYPVPDGASAPSGDAEVIARDLPATPDHSAKSVALIGHAMYVNIGSPSNACQVANRVLHSPGKDPCDELATRAGIWRFDAETADQTLDCGTRYATGLRNTNALAVDPATDQLWGGINGRDQLHENWPELYTEDQDKVLPSDEVVAITAGLDRGWPYCYHDVLAGEMKLAPEYGGDGVVQGRCAQIPSPEVALDAHAAVLGMVFVTGTQFPPAYRAGALVANHGSRFDALGTAGLHGYDVEFLPFAHGAPTGDVLKFATGFDAGLRPLPDAAPHRPVGLAMMPDGSLLIGDDQGGRIWRVFYTGS